jgi:hypothetical protein
MKTMYGFVQMYGLSLRDLFVCEISNGVAVTTTVVGKDWLSLENLNLSFIWEIRTLVIAGKKKENRLLRIAL